MITAADVRALQFTMGAHLNFGGGSYSATYISTEHPRLIVTRHTPKRSKKDPNPRTQWRCWFGDLEIPYGDWQLVADLLNGLEPTCCVEGCEIELLKGVSLQA